MTGTAHGSRGPAGREHRGVCMLKAHLITDEGSTAITICNVAGRGLMARAAVLPTRGSFVEVRCAGYTVIGQVRWAQGGRFGIRSQDRIDMAALRGMPTIGGQARTGGSRASRSRLARQARSTTVQEKEEQSRHVARTLDWVVLAVAGIGGAAAVAGAVHAAVSAPMEQARDAFAAPK